jgi:hypothetical protein
VDQWRKLRLHDGIGVIEVNDHRPWRRCVVFSNHETNHTSLTFGPLKMIFVRHTESGLQVHCAVMMVYSINANEGSIERFRSNRQGTGVGGRFTHRRSDKQTSGRVMLSSVIQSMAEEH